MDFKKHFSTICQFLAPFEPLWSDELIFAYPNHMKGYKEEWAHELQGLSQEDLWQYDCRLVAGLPESSELKKLTQKILELTNLPQIHSGPEIQLPSWAFFKVNGKKEHEILQIAPKIQELYKDYQGDFVIDIGGGQGHLSRTLAHYFDIPMLSIDISSEFQELGKKRLKKYPEPEGAKKIQFLNQPFSSKNEDLKDYFSQAKISLGLHTCGSLAIDHLKAYDQWNGKALINFGCCYNRLDPKIHFKLSQYAKENCPFDLNKLSMTLATRGHTEITLNEFILKRQVKRFRYGLHLLHFHLLDIKEFIKVGSSFPRHYRGEFVPYALMKLEDAGIQHNLTEKQISDFFEQEWVQETIERLFLLNLVRWQFGRLIEHLILVDRALWLEEQGHQVEMMEFFDQEKSPRNIGIIAKAST